MADASWAQGLRNPAVIAAFGGWNDAGEAAARDRPSGRPVQRRTGVRHRPGEFYDFQVNRPTTRLIDGKRTIEWPTTEVLVAHLPERDLAIGGPEPNYRWQEYLHRPLSLLRSVRPEIEVARRAGPTPAHPPGTGDRDVDQ